MNPSSSSPRGAVVVGGGPAGMTVALELEALGAAVTLVDEAPAFGGQYFKPRPAAVRARYGEHRRAGDVLRARLARSSVRALPGHLVWGVHDDGRTLLVFDSAAGAHREIRSEAIVVATGAYERSLPFLGWQLPGVVTPGYALHLSACDVVRLGEQVVVAGSGPFLLVAAAAVLRAGGGVRAVVELNRPYGLSSESLGASRHLGRVRELFGYLLPLARARVPILQGCQVVEARGAGRVEQVVVRDVDTGRPRDFPCDALAISYGFRPAGELARLLGVSGRSDEWGDFVPDLDAQGRASRPLTYVAGEVAGIAGMHAARARGALAADAVASDLGIGGLPQRRLAAARRALRRELAFSRRTGRLYPLAPGACLPEDDGTLICRCEGVTLGAIRSAMTIEAVDISGVKGATRAGMGPCQGRECAPALVSLLGAQAGFPARMPIKPVPMPLPADPPS